MQRNGFLAKINNNPLVEKARVLHRCLIIAVHLFRVQLHWLALYEQDEGTREKKREGNSDFPRKLFQD